MLWWTNLENDKKFGIFKFKTLTNFQNLTILKIKLFFYFTIWKINILPFEKLLNILSIQMISKKWKNTIIKLSKNSSFVILIFATSKFRNFSRSTFRRSKFWPPPNCNNFYSKTKLTILCCFSHHIIRIWGKFF